jgi:hypothetical protein
LRGLLSCEREVVLEGEDVEDYPCEALSISSWQVL